MLIYGPPCRFLAALPFLALRAFANDLLSFLTLLWKKLVLIFLGIGMQEECKAIDDTWSLKAHIPKAPASSTPTFSLNS